MKKESLACYVDHYIRIGMKSCTHTHTHAHNLPKEFWSNKYVP